MKNLFMTNEELNAKYLRLVDKVRKMRGRQIEYFKYRAKTDLDAAKRFEREVDALIMEEVNKQKSGQQDLFQ